MASPPPSKLCPTCGRRFAWRRRWERCWDAVRYCSERCRTHRPNRTDLALEEEIRRRLRALTRPDASLCPSEATRAVGGADWRRLSERTRNAARRLAAAGELQILQGGRVVDPATMRGPVRLRRRLTGG